MQKFQFLKNKILPCVILPAIVGTVSGALIFIFKVSSSHIIRISGEIYSYARLHPKYIPIVIAGNALVGVLSALILKHARECRGGGIPTAIASIRGLVPIKWIQGIFALFVSALLTFLAGVPLGNEGPSVQMGTATGKGWSRLLGSKRRAWERYIMTGGASSGFAAATGAPLSGIVFALEETHRRFSPTIFIVASVSVLCGAIVEELLSSFFGVESALFSFNITEPLPTKYLWVSIIVGVLCGIFARIFTNFYTTINRLREKNLAKTPFPVKISAIFTVSAVLGLISLDFIGSGHSLIEKIAHDNSVWYLILSAFVIRALLMICANTEGVSGGIFLPTLAFGAIIAALFADSLLALNILDAKYFAIIVSIGMSSFFAASARTPITALIFAAEVLCGGENVLPVGIGVVIAYLIAEASGKLSFTDTVIETKVAKEHRGKTPVIVDTHMTAMPNSFAVGMEIRDILWPPTCTVLSVDKADINSTGIVPGDRFHLHYQTYNPEYTAKVLTHILGVQESSEKAKLHFGSEEHIVPLE